MHSYTIATPILSATPGLKLINGLYLQGREVISRETKGAAPSERSAEDFSAEEHGTSSSRRGPCSTTALFILFILSVAALLVVVVLLVCLCCHKTDDENDLPAPDIEKGWAHHFNVVLPAIYRYVNAADGQSPRGPNPNRVQEVYVTKYLEVYGTKAVWNGDESLTCVGRVERGRGLELKDVGRDGNNAGDRRG